MQTMRRRIIFISFWVVATSALGQSSDSLKQVLSRITDDSIKYELSSQLFSIEIYKNLDSAKKYLRAQKHYLSLLSNAKMLSIDYYNNEGIYYNQRGLSDSAVWAYQKSYELAKKYDKRRIMAIALNNIANVHYIQGNFPISLDFHLQSLKIRETIADTQGIAMSLGNIGLIYSSQKKYDKAIEYYRKAEEYFTKLKNEHAVTWTNRMIGIAYLDTKRYDKAHYYLKKGLRQCRMQKDKSGQLYTLLNLGLLYVAQYEDEKQSCYLDSAEWCLSEISPLLEKIKNKRIEINYVNNLAQIKIYRKQYAEALNLLQNIDSSFSAMDFKTEAKNLYRFKSEAFEGLGDYQRALIAYKQFKAVSDTIFNVEKDKEIGQKEAWLGYNEKLKIEKLKNKSLLQQEELKKATLRSWLVVLILLGIIVTSVSVFVFLKLTKERRLLRQQKNQILSKYNDMESAYSEVFANLKELKEKQETQECSILPEWVSALSKRETEVLSCLAIGLSDKEISNKLFISVTTVRTHCQRIYGKLLVKNRAEAAHLAREYNLL